MASLAAAGAALLRGGSGVADTRAGHDAFTVRMIVLGAEVNLVPVGSLTLHTDFPRP